MSLQKKGRNRPNADGVDSDGEIILAPIVRPSKRSVGIDKVIVRGAATQRAAEPEPLEFRDFADGGLVELVRDSVDHRRTKLLVWRNGDARIQNCFRYGGKEFSPLQLEPSLLEAIRLPMGVTPCGSTQVLLGEISDRLSQYMDLGEDQLRLVGIVALYTWFQDLISVAPYLWIVGPYSAGKSTLLALLHCICRRGISISDFTPAALYSLPGSIKPTLLIDEFEMLGRSTRERDLLRLLRTGTAQGGQVVRGSKIYQTFCAKVIASRQGPQDTALASRAIFISLRPTRKALPALDNSTLDKIAAQFQPQLLEYRLRHYAEAAASFRSEVPDFTPRMKDLARALAVPLFGDTELKNELFCALRDQDEEAKLGRYGEREWAVAAALYADCHRAGPLTMGDLARTVARVLAENGETYSLSPRAVGEILRCLGLRTEQLGNQGRGLRLSQAVIRQIHELARDLGLKRSDILPWFTVEGGYGGYPCSLCDELKLMVRGDGEPLRCLQITKPKRGGLYS